MCDLGSLPAARLRFSAVPVKVSGFGTFPVRAYAVVEE
jgi:kynurenine formamidase